ncbi:MAG: cytochrome c [Planctomycetes bacterium]|nr:cytochrome c [Planctomycetota bacterium]MBL7009419.1 cytochrome c [Planctomycetota bacterium]
MSFPRARDGGIIPAMERLWKPILLGAACTLLVAACGGEDSGPSKVARSRGEQVFAETCSTCHGKTGIGDGLAAAALDPKPRNYTDAAWQASVTDDRIKEIIVKGGEAMGLSVGMPAHAHLKNDPDALEGLVWKIRSFAE